MILMGMDMEVKNISGVIIHDLTFLAAPGVRRHVRLMVKILVLKSRVDIIEGLIKGTVWVPNDLNGRSRTIWRCLAPLVVLIIWK